MKAAGIHWQTVFMSVLCSAGLFAVGTLVVVFAVLPMFSLKLDLSEQDMQISLPKSLPMTVALEEPLTTHIAGPIKARVPIDQTLPMRIHDRLDLVVAMDAMLPMNFDVVINDLVQVDSVIETKVLGMPMALPIKGKLPLNMVVPINQTVPMKFKVPLSAYIQEQFEIHLKTEIDTEVSLDDDLRIPISEPLQTTIGLTESHPLNVRVKTTAINVPLESMHLAPLESAQSESP